MGEHSYTRHMQTRARAALERDLAAGAAIYERGKSLVRVLPLMAGQCEGPEPETTRRIVRRLAEALRRERRLGRAGHWTYDLNRHVALAQAFRAESDALRAARRAK